MQQYTFCLLIFLWTDTKLIVNLEFGIHVVKKTREFHDNESENISGESKLLCRCGTIYNVQTNFDITVSFFIRIYELQRGRVSWACCAGEVIGPDIRASHCQNSGKRAYRPTRVIQSLCTKEHHI